MREYREATCRNLLKRPLVLGVRIEGLLALALLIAIVQLAFSQPRLRDCLSVGIGAIGYLGLRIATRILADGYQESIFFFFESRISKIRRKNLETNFEYKLTKLPLETPDTLDAFSLVQRKETLKKRFLELEAGEQRIFLFDSDKNGTSVIELESTPGQIPNGATISDLSEGLLDNSWHAYSLFQLPSHTDPLWIFSLISPLKIDFKIFLMVRGLDQAKSKREIEGSRKRTSHGVADGSVDSDITFEETTRVLEGLTRGNDTTTEISFVVLSKDPIKLNKSHFLEEKNKTLAIASVMGLRHRLHRSHIVRSVTAADLTPNFCDPNDGGKALLKSPREKPLYFDPTDKSFDSLHWLVAGATGSGKSFFTGLILRRLLKNDLKASVLFIDHNCSFRRLVKAESGEYLEPSSVGILEASLSGCLKTLNGVGTMAGIELADLNEGDKKQAITIVLSDLSQFLRKRNSAHPIYVVLDEAWALMHNEPILVQRAFREFRKLNCGTIAISQSLSDFIDKNSRQSIFQNVPIKILLRHAEDLEQYRSSLGLNSQEIDQLRSLSKESGEFSECLIKLPTRSHIARLYPTKEEHDLLRTDNLREEEIKRTLGRFEVVHG